MLKIKMLGPLQVEVGGETATFRTDALRVLLAYLAAHQNVPQRRDTLAGLLSPDRSNKAALTYLRNRLSRLRRTIHDDEVTPPWFAIDRKQVGLRAGEDIVVDVAEFDRLLARVEAHAHRRLVGCPTCMTGLETAVSLYRGDLLTGLNFPSDIWESWLLGQREHYQQRALAAMTLLRDALIERGDWAAVLAVTQRQLSLEVWLEAAHHAAMLAHYHLGDRNAALSQYEQFEQLLWDELGVKPEEETAALFERIKDELGIMASSLPSPVPDNLPLQTGLFFGRKREQEQLLQRLVDPNYRLVTLVGAGGIGKTRLAIEVGKQVKMSFSDGVWFVPLDAVKGGAEQIKIAVGEAVGLGQGSQQDGVGKQLTGEQVLAILRDKQMLLIFDNSEPVLEEILFIPEWLKRAPQIAILATSREPLNFQAESVIVLDGLPTGTMEMSAAEAMFAERGHMARDDFMVTAENLPQIRQICDLVDGSPLGIGLAAAWVRRRSLIQIIEGIGHSLDMLSSRLRDIDPRHRSMRAVFETSWQMLVTEEQGVLAALSVFPEGITAVAAANVAGATLFVLDLLCEKSLLQQQQESARYFMHSLVRQFSAEKLGDGLTAVNHAFVDYFYRYAQDHQQTYEHLQPEWRSFSVGITKAHGLGAWQVVLDFAQVLDEPWFRQVRFTEMREGLTYALKAATTLHNRSAMARTLLRLGEIEIEQNDYASAEAHLTHALDHLMQLEDGLSIAHTKYALGRIKLEQSQDAQALALCTESKNIFEEEGDTLGVAKNLNLLAYYYLKQNLDFQIAQQYLEQSVLLQRPLSVSVTYVEALRFLARIKSKFGLYIEAEKCLIEAASVCQKLQDEGEGAAILYDRVVLCKRREQLESGLRLGYECLDRFKKLGSLRWEALVKTQLAILHQAKHQLRLALSLFNQSLDIFIELADIYEQAYTNYYLYKLHIALEQIERSDWFKRQAIQLNLQLNDPQLGARLE